MTREMRDATTGSSRHRGRSAAVAVVAAAMLTLTGCSAGSAEAEGTSATPQPTHSAETAASPTATLGFGSDEEALAAGVAALQAALDVEVETYGRPGDHTERFEEVSTGNYLRSMIEGAQTTSHAGFTFDGAYVVEPLGVQQVQEGAEGARVIFYACLDTSGVHRWDSTGAEVPGRSAEKRFQILSVVQRLPQRDQVESMDRWSYDPC